MNVPIRMLGIVTSIFWVFLIAFIALAAYSVKDLSVDFGEPEYSVTPHGKLNLALPLYIDNRGHYSLKDFCLSTVFSDAKGAEISRSETIVPLIQHGENITITHNAALDPMSLLERDEQYLFYDNHLNVSFTAGLNFAELIPAEISANFTFPWGAPFYNFSIGEPSFEVTDFTHTTISAPMSFENHAVFDVGGNVRIELYNNDNTLLSESQNVLYVPQYSRYERNIEFSVTSTALSLSNIQSGHFEVYFDLGVVQYGPMVIKYG
jgi:hypothetical protein